LYIRQPQLPEKYLSKALYAITVHFNEHNKQVIELTLFGSGF